MKELIRFYREWLGFNKYYEIIISNVKSCPYQFNQNIRFLEGTKSDNVENYHEFSTKDNDLRIDVPVWFGNLNSSKNRILVFGLEPRDTNKKFNIERVNNHVFGTPFGVDRWNTSSTVLRKPQNKYFRVFKQLSEQTNSFLIFSDIVKYFKIIDQSNINGVNDHYARANFIKHASKSKEKLLEEIRIINPTHIITLGNDSNRVVKSVIPEFEIRVFGIRHPANGGETVAKEQINQLLIKP